MFSWTTVLFIVSFVLPWCILIGVGTWLTLSVPPGRKSAQSPAARYPK
jgi:hypothetical protein